MRWLVLLATVAACGRLDFGARGKLDGGSGADGATTDGPPDAYAGPNRVFISTTTTDGAMGGLAGADAICQADADAAGLGGTFGALLWDGAMTPSQRLAGSRGWVDLQGRPIADQPTDFDTGATLYPIELDAHGQRTAADYAWTGHNTTGCADWTAAPGGTFIPANSVSASLFWGIPASSQCTDTLALNCVEHGRAVPVAVTPTTVPSRVVFLSETPFSSGGGLAAADAVCAGDASAAGLPGKFIAWLGSSTGAPETRATTGMPWRRPDGVLIGADDSVLMSGDLSTTLSTFVTEYASGAPGDGSPTFTGANGMHCDDWTATTTSDFGSYGQTGETVREQLEYSGMMQCAFAEHLLCFEL